MSDMQEQTEARATPLLDIHIPAHCRMVELDIYLLLKNRKLRAAGLTPIPGDPLERDLESVADALELKVKLDANNLNTHETTHAFYSSTGQLVAIFANRHTSYHWLQPLIHQRLQRRKAEAERRNSITTSQP